MTTGRAFALEANRLRWLRLGGWAVGDQALFATANFALGILLARWLTPEEFGAFTIAQSVFFLFGVLHIAVLAEPMMVFGTSRYARDFPSYLHHLVRGHWLITSGGAALILLAAGGCWLRGSDSLAVALVGAAFATPTTLLVWLARRACFACLRPHLAATAGAAYLLLMVAGILAVYRLDLLSALAAFVILGLCSVVVGSVLLRVLRGSRGADSFPQGRELAGEHWRYGRWALASSTLSWLTGNVWYFVLPLVGGLAAAGALRALSNLVLPMYQVITALSMLLLPTLARARGTARFRKVLVIALGGFVGSAALYWVIVATLAAPTVDLLYGGNYSEYAHLLWLMGLLPVIGGVVAVVGNALRACERPDLVFWAYAASAGVTLSFGIWMVDRWGVTGAVLGQLAASAATATVLIGVYRRHGRERDRVPGGDAARTPDPGLPLVRVRKGQPA